MENGGKRAIEIAHRRWGKDEIALHWAAVSAMMKPATYWHMLPEYAQARKAIWNAVNPHTGIRRIDEAFPKEIRAQTIDDQMFIRFINGSTWQVVGSDSYNSLVGASLYGIVMSEWALANPSAWAYLSPIIEESGGWAMFITTSRGKNHAHGMYKMAEKDPIWFAQKQTVIDTKFPLERVEAARREYHALYGIEAGDALIEQEYYCSFDAAVLGAVYGAAMARADKSGRIKQSVVWDKDLPTYTAWDLGFDDSTAIWFWQIIRGEIRLIDYYENSGQDIEHYCNIIKAKEYWYAKHFVPHDAAAKLLAAGGRSIVQQAYGYGIKMFVVAATSQQNGIEAARKTIEISWFNDETCAKGIEALKQYQFEYDDEKKIFRSKPRHDWASHGSDAFEIIGQVWRNPVVLEPDEKPKFLEDLTAKDVFFPENPKKPQESRY